MDLITILLSVIGFFLTIAVRQLISISKSLSEIKTALEVLTTKQNYLEERVKHLENINFNQNKTHQIRNL
jgi:hypothetical protein